MQKWFLLLTLLFLSPAQADGEQSVVSLLQADTYSSFAVVPGVPPSEKNEDSQNDDLQDTVANTQQYVAKQVHWLSSSYGASRFAIDNEFHPIRAPPFFN